jgi:cyclopropane-fatty-acyl-phospholipid synthase
VTLDGTAPWDLRVKDDRFFARVLAEGALGMGESYMEGWWECERLDELICRIHASDIDAVVKRDLRTQLAAVRAKIVNLQTVRRAPTIAHAHYDLSNEFFAAMLGPTMTYSCGYWAEAGDLDAAQTAKLDLVCRKLALRAGEHLLDIGCGWGSLARHAAERYGVRVTGITISEPQAAWARERCAGLPIEIVVADYRDPVVRRRGPFDKIASVGMFEHVGVKNYPVFMRLARSLLTERGLFLLHTIGRASWSASADRWVDRYVFPNGILPTSGQIAVAADRHFVLEDWHNFGADYDRTLMAWLAGFERHVREGGALPDVPSFERLWRYYLCGFAGCFRARSRMQLWQVLYSPRGVTGGYRVPR